MAFWATVGLVVVLVGYPLSFGPACWWYSSADPEVYEIAGSDSALHYAPLIYSPIGWVAEFGPDPLGDAIFWYAQVGITDKKRIQIPTSFSGKFCSDSLRHDILRMLR